MARPIDPNSPYRVSIHVTKGYRYASTQPSTIDPETGKKTHRQVHWGTIDENNKFFPGNKYLLASVEERKKLIFPADWDLSEIDKLSGKKKDERPAREGQDENRLYGDIWLLEQIAEVTGIREDLLKTFGQNDELVDIVMTLAVYLLCGKGTYHQLAAWQKVAKAPFSLPLTSSFITRFTQSITEQHRMDLLRHRMKRLGENALCAVDSTSRSAWGNSLADIRYGKSKDHLPLPQTTEVVVYSLTDHMPIYYRTFPGNMPDSRSLETILKDLEGVGMKDVVLVTDRGYESIRNLEMYIERGQPMIMGTKTSQSHVMNKIEKFGTIDHRPEEMEVDIDEKIYFKQYPMDYQMQSHQVEGKSFAELKLNLYFDPARRSRELTEIDVAIVFQKRLLQEILEIEYPMDDDATLARAFCFFKLEYDKNTRILKNFTLDEKKIARKRKTSGFFANTTYLVDFDAMQVQHHYRLRDEQEKYFAMMKGVMGADRQRNWSEAGKTGRLFILFVAQVLGSYLSYIRSTKLKDQYDSILDILNEMRPIRYVAHGNTQPYISPFVGNQVKICDEFGFDIPEGCAPESAARKTATGKRGRPRKNPLG